MEECGKRSIYGLSISVDTSRMTDMPKCKLTTLTNVFHKKYA